MVSRVIIAILLAILVDSSLQLNFTNCPDDSSIVSPCKCTGWDSWGSIGPKLHCGGDKPIDFGAVFKRLSEYYTKEYADRFFDAITINNTAITEIKENDFADLRFASIYIYDNTNLTKIHKNAFEHSMPADLIWENNPKVDAEQVFQLADTFEHMERFIVDVERIPSDGFKRDHDTTWLLEFAGPNVKNVQPKAFKHFKGKKGQLFVNPLLIVFSNTGIETFPDEAFVVAGDKVLIEFENNGKFTGNTFSPKTFKVGANTVTTVQFDPIMPYLNETAFKTLFNDNEENIIRIESGKLDCNDTRNDWLKPYAHRIEKYNC